MAPVSLKFLGTGGGRFATMYQARSTGGCLLEAGTRVHIDPGPGALLRARQEGEDPTRTRAVLVTHAHPDHYTEAEVVIEAMTRGGTARRGTFVGSVSALEGTESHDAVLSRYHRSRPEQAFAVRPGEHFKLGEVTVRATVSHHRDETTVGFRFATPEGVIGYVADTALEEDVIRAHRGSRVLVLPATRPRGKRIAWHLCTEDVAQAVAAIRPEVALLNHLGLKMVRTGPDEEARWVEEQTGVRTVAASDGMRATVSDSIEIGRMERVGGVPPAGLDPGEGPE
ncbi:MAG TPA: MBL fold metallo-hydrolase [Candidatus Thermoplasmatota archaeon]